MSARTYNGLGGPSWASQVCPECTTPQESDRQQPHTIPQPVCPPVPSLALTLACRRPGEVGRDEPLYPSTSAPSHADTQRHTTHWEARSLWWRAAGMRRKQSSIRSHLLPFTSPVTEALEGLRRLGLYWHSPTGTVASLHFMTDIVSRGGTEWRPCMQPRGRIVLECPSAKALLAPPIPLPAIYHISPTARGAIIPQPLHRQHRSYTSKVSTCADTVQPWDWPSSSAQAWPVVVQGACAGGAQSSEQGGQSHELGREVPLTHTAGHGNTGQLPTNSLPDTCKMLLWTKTKRCVQTVQTSCKTYQDLLETLLCMDFHFHGPLHHHGNHPTLARKQHR